MVIMKTSMAYRLFRVYFNSNANNFQLFGNRVYNPLNGTIDQKSQHLGAIIRATLILITLGALAAVIMM